MSTVRTLREARDGSTTLRLVSQDAKLIGVTIVAGKIRSQIDGSDADEVWQRLTRDAAKADPGYLGYDGARSRFISMFPGGFGSQEYIDTERTYKVTASERLVDAVSLTAAADGQGFTDAAIKAFSGTNLVYPVEKTRAHEMLRGPMGDAFVRAAARFTLEPSAPALRTMENILKQYDNARWTVVTYLPFLWARSRHMFLKPQVTQDFARRVGHPFARAYEPRLDLVVYEMLLQLIAETEREIAVLQPRDRIDTQSFVWVAGEYKAADVPTEEVVNEERH